MTMLHFMPRFETYICLLKDVSVAWIEDGSARGNVSYICYRTALCLLPFLTSYFVTSLLRTTLVFPSASSYHLQYPMGIPLIPPAPMLALYILRETSTVSDGGIN